MILIILSLGVALVARRFVAVRNAMDVYLAHLYQSVLNDFMSEGHFSRHVRRTRLLYAERRSVFVDAIQNEFGSRLEVLGADAGLHLVMTLPRGVADREISQRAREKTSGFGLFHFVTLIRIVERD
jgi:GntR family transcriptional regulator / MocR family aminotransferase